MKLNNISKDPRNGAKCLYDDVMVRGSHHREEQCFKFLKLLDRSKLGRDAIEAKLIPDPNNRHDENAIKVIGIITRPGLFGAKTKTFHLGYLPAGLSASLFRRSIDPKQLFAKLEAFDYYDHLDYPIEITISIHEA